MFDELKKLNLPNDKFAIFGSGPLAVRGIRDSDDIDIIVSESLWDELMIEHEPFDEKNNLIKIDKIEIWKDWPYLSKTIDEIIDDSETIDGLPFVKLKYVRQWKEGMGREKDKKDIELIDEYLKK